MIDWSIDWREWFDIQEPDSAAMIDWSQCPDAESVPDRCAAHGWSRERGFRFRASSTTPRIAPGGNRSPNIFPSLTVEQVRRVLRFAYQSQLAVLYDERR